ncbi:hypothetical protein [Planctomyces sp. SH-PL14]|uniref:hypothetical protein n=1 Tax=Planctomyces sp. SH-PL14 TaxID=1632864 RepID=UPI001E585E1A|nr:hypothetical protein [Planctomyces sp. SH-PL14]
MFRHLFQVWQEREEKARPAETEWQLTMKRLIGMGGDSDLPEVGRTLAASRGCTAQLNCWKQQRDQQADNGNRHQQFNNAESSSSRDE